MTAQHQPNGVSNPARRKNENFRLYEHGVAITDLARRTTTLEEHHKECDEWREKMTASHMALDKKLDKLINRAWGVGKTLAVGATFFTASIGAVIWIGDHLGVVVKFGGLQ